ncbi:MAG TPA: hypothetical protein DCM86_17440 [Verrucomicrobiales bacterium]|nr:hypothetical protein [Verrucomicrobiales bacterium]
MKRVLLLVIGVGSVVVGVVLGADRARAPAPKAPVIREFMRQKLAHSQSVLEGLALEDYNLVLLNARKLVAMSQEGSWRVLEAPEYGEQSLAFRRNAEALVKAANMASLDAATLAYVKMTMSCIECHKYVRSRQSASLPGAPSSGPTGGVAVSE